MQRAPRALLPSLLLGRRAALKSLKAKNKCEALGIASEEKTPSAFFKVQNRPACWMPFACLPFPGPHQAGLLDAVRSKWYPGASWAAPALSWAHLSPRAKTTSEKQPCGGAASSRSQSAERSLGCEAPMGLISLTGVNFSRRVTASGARGSLALGRRFFPA